MPERHELRIDVGYYVSVIKLLLILILLTTVAEAAKHLMVGDTYAIEPATVTLITTKGFEGSTMTLSAFNVSTTSASVTGTRGLSVTYGYFGSTMTLSSFNVGTTSASATGSNGFLSTNKIDTADSYYSDSVRFAWNGGGTGTQDTCVGHGTCGSLTGSVSTTIGNTAFGFNAMEDAVSNQNTMVGAFAGSFLHDGDDNTIVGYGAGGSLIHAAGNTMVGKYAGAIENQYSSTNTYVGLNAGAIDDTNILNNAIALGANAIVSSSHTAQIGGREGSGFEVLLKVSSASVTSGYFQFASKTVAQLQQITPTATHQMYGCSDCTALYHCISTGTAKGAFASPVAKITACN